MGPRRIGLAAALAVLAVDQITKWWIVHEVMDPPRVIEVAPVLNIVMAWNRGVSFGLLASDSPWGPWLLLGLALGVVAALAVWMARTGRTRLTLAIGLIIGGALGNVIDRLRWGAVADFVDLHVGGWHWPAFNVADAAITVGALVLVADSLFGGGESRKREPE